MNFTHLCETFERAETVDEPDLIFVALTIGDELTDLSESLEKLYRSFESRY